MFFKFVFPLLRQSFSFLRYHFLFVSFFLLLFFFHSLLVLFRITSHDDFSASQYLFVTHACSTSPPSPGESRHGWLEEAMGRFSAKVTPFLVIFFIDVVVVVRTKKNYLTMVLYPRAFYFAFICLLVVCNRVCMCVCVLLIHCLLSLFIFFF